MCVASAVNRLFRGIASYRGLDLVRLHRCGLPHLSVLPVRGRQTELFACSAKFPREFGLWSYSNQRQQTDQSVEGARMSSVYRLIPSGWQECVEPAVRALCQDGIIAVPTDTLYGVAGLAQSTNAIETIYKLKIRSPQNPISICVADVADVYQWSKVTISEQLLTQLLPGPVTLVFERAEQLNPGLNPGLQRVGVRVPDHEFIREIARAAGQPLALTSANLSGQTSPLSVDELNGICSGLAAIFDGGVLGSTEQARLGSTVVDLSSPGQFTIIRPGSAEKATVELLTAAGLTSATATASSATATSATAIATSATATATSATATATSATATATATSTTASR